MNPSLSVARGLMRLAQWITPPSRDGWKAAMQGEFAAIEGRGQALSWSAGCLTTALGWRLTVEAPLVAGMIAAALAVKAVYLAWFWTADVSTAAWVAQSAWVTGGLVVVACAAMTALKPRRMWLIGLAFPLLHDGGQWLAFMGEAIGSAPFAWRDNNPQLPTLLLVLFALALQAGPGLVSALTAGGLARAIRRRGVQASR